MVSRYDILYSLFTSHPMELKEMSLEQLKAAAYDAIRQGEISRVNI